MKRSIWFTLLLTLTALTGMAQQNPFSYQQSPIYTFDVQGTVQPGKVTTQWRPQLQNMEAAFPGGDSYRSFLLQQKAQLPQRNGGSRTGGVANLGDADLPALQRSFLGNPFDGSVPCDNDVAFSNDGWLISVVNSNISMYDMNQDSMMQNISLEDFADTLGLTYNMYDPKVIYDPVEDRFIMIWLSGNTDTTSNIVVSFSSTNNPLDAWYIYSLPGDAVGQGVWSDYPIVAITNDELFIAVNALINDTINTSDSWKFLFKESTVWQIDKSDGYSGDLLDTRFYHDFYYNNTPIRNLCPIQGGSSTTGPNIYLLSNRNFDMVNDTFFVMEITGLLSDGNTQATVDISLADVPYGLAPDGQQSVGAVLQTNDSRVLGGYIEDGTIHFVQNSVNPDTNRAGIYHGIITDLGGSNTITGQVISEEHLDYGYPNISYTGQYAGDDEALITFNYTSEDSFAGVAAVYYQGGVGYSERLNIKSGESYVNALSGPNERWGDYTGTQRVYNQPGRVWMSGYIGYEQGFSDICRAWVAELQSPDSLDVVSAPLVNAPATKAKLYPNPAYNLFTTEFEVPESQQLSISLYNAQGKQVRTFFNDRAKAGLNRFSFSAEPLEPGIYFLRITGQKGFAISKRVVKQ